MLEIKGVSERWKLLEEYQGIWSAEEAYQDGVVPNIDDLGKMSPDFFDGRVGDDRSPVLSSLQGR